MGRSTYWLRPLAQAKEFLTVERLFQVSAHSGLVTPFTWTLITAGQPVCKLTTSGFSIWFLQDCGRIEFMSTTCLYYWPTIQSPRDGSLWGKKIFTLYSHKTYKVSAPRKPRTEGLFLPLGASSLSIPAILLFRTVLAKSQRPGGLNNRLIYLTVLEAQNQAVCSPALFWGLLAWLVPSPDPDFMCTH